MKILAVTSGKGGVGKTTISLNIARQLSLHGVRVLVGDLDIHNKGATGLFLDRVSESSPSVMRTVHESNHFDRERAAELANKTEPLRLDKEGRLLFLPASAPKEMVKWNRFVAENSTIVGFFEEFFRVLAERCVVDVIVLDCYGGVDSLTVAAAGLAEDTIVVNEPDLITFSGTLLLYNYLADTYKDAARKPRVHFVINRITSRHSFDFLVLQR
jgi:cellulose biosynthesis protein BcsQ